MVRLLSRDGIWREGIPIIACPLVLNNWRRRMRGSSSPTRVGAMPGQRRRRWPGIAPTLVQTVAPPHHTLHHCLPQADNWANWKSTGDDIWAARTRQTTYSILIIRRRGRPVLMKFTAAAYVAPRRAPRPASYYRAAKRCGFLNFCQNRDCEVIP